MKESLAVKKPQPAFITADSSSQRQCSSVLIQIMAE